MSITVSPAVAFAYGYASVQAAEADTEFLASLPDDSEPKTALQVEMENMWAQAAEAQVKASAQSKPLTVWGTIDLDIGTVTIYSENTMSFTSSDGKSHSFEDIADLDWEAENTPQEILTAILEKHSGKITASSVESGKKSMTSELMSKMFSSDALINRMFLTEDGGGMEDGLAETDEASSSVATVATGDLQAVQTQAAAV
ncbi:hypothetical protein [Allorhizobium taibaishanense]|uniref:Uncharacterized protein n=1 Tax=Allorhizobium taibaishanense TaxID=887144 RepID=A0A7W6HKX6_9HYPH|nr:hypothetical protein [Allorhizobium taibaishanense]MBB4007162.1 hypothetical protein [Allorhizobium taibaishanense]